MSAKCCIFRTGSGSSYAYGVLDSGYSRSLSVEEAVALAKRAIYAASFRDYGTGGQVLGSNKFIITVYPVHTISNVLETVTVVHVITSQYFRIT